MWNQGPTEITLNKEGISEGLYGPWLYWTLGYDEIRNNILIISGWEYCGTRFIYANV